RNWCCCIASVSQDESSAASWPSGRGSPEEWWASSTRNDVILRRIILVPGYVREQLANGDFAGARQIRKVLRDFVLDGEFTLLIEQENRRGSELLADRAEGIARGGIGIAAGSHVRAAERLGVDQLAISDDGNRDAGCAALLESRCHFASELAVELLRLLGGEQKRACKDQ